MCLAQGPQRSDACEARTAAPRSRVKHSTTEPLRSQKITYILDKKTYHVLASFPPRSSEHFAHYPPFLYLRAQ